MPRLYKYDQINQDELHFISQLGKYDDPDTRKKKLKGYLLSCYNRDDWGQMDKATIIAHARYVCHMIGVDIRGIP